MYRAYLCRTWPHYTRYLKVPIHPLCRQNLIVVVWKVAKDSALHISKQSSFKLFDVFKFLNASDYLLRIVCCLMELNQNFMTSFINLNV